MLLHRKIGLSMVNDPFPPAPAAKGVCPRRAGRGRTLSMGSAAWGTRRTGLSIEARAEWRIWRRALADAYYDTGCARGWMCATREVWVYVRGTCMEGGDSVSIDMERRQADDRERERLQLPEVIAPDDIYWAAIPCEKCGAAEFYSRAVGG